MINYLNRDVFENDIDLKNFKSLLDKNKSNLNFDVPQDLKVWGLLYFIDKLNQELNLSNSNFDLIIWKVKIIVWIICRNKWEESEYFLKNLESKYNFNWDLVNQILSFEIKPTKETKEFIRSIKNQRDEKNNKKLWNDEDFENWTLELSKIFSKKFDSILKEYGDKLLLGVLFNELVKLIIEKKETSDISDRIEKLDKENSLQFFREWEEFYKLWNYIDAIKSYDKYIWIYPYNSFIYEKKWGCLKKLWNLKEAVECYDKAIKLNMNYSELYFAKWLILYELWDFEKAIECYDKVIKLEPNDLHAYNLKWCCLYKLWDFEKAIECFSKKIEIEPTADLYCNKWICLLELWKYEEGILSLDIAINLDPNNNRPYLCKFNYLWASWKINKNYEKIITIENWNKKLKKLIKNNDIDWLNSYLLKLK